MSRLNKFDSPFKDLLQARKLNRLERYQLENTITSNNVSGHTHWVLILSLIIKDQIEPYIKKTYHRSISYKVLVEMATFHDLGECVTGDMDYIAKKAGVLDTKGEAEFIWNRFHSSDIFSKYLDSIMVDQIEEGEWDWEKNIVKCADMLEHLIYCYEEQELFGNRSMFEPLTKGVEVVRDQFKEVYMQSDIVQEITDRCELALKTNPLS